MPAFRTVIFDCDSTLSAIEGIEELASGHRKEVEQLTELAMQGMIPLEDVYGRRLELIRPSRKDVDRVGRLYIEKMLDGALAVVHGLMEQRIGVHILSGGLLPAVRVLGHHLDIPDPNIAAVDLWFDAQGRYRGFDLESPLARSGGKRVWIESRRDLIRPILLIGDGATDLEARPAVDRFAAFAGVVRRDPVVAAADYVLTRPSLTPILELVKTGVLPPNS